MHSYKLRILCTSCCLCKDCETSSAKSHLRTGCLTPLASRHVHTGCSTSPAWHRKVLYCFSALEACSAHQFRKDQKSERRIKHISRHPALKGVWIASLPANGHWWKPTPDQWQDFDSSPSITWQPLKFQVPQAESFRQLSPFGGAADQTCFRRRATKKGYYLGNVLRMPNAQNVTQ